MKRFLGAIALAFAVLAALPAWAVRNLYAATAHDDPVTGKSVGDLYVVDPVTAKSRLVGAILVDGKTPVSMDGLAVHPKTGVLYGITSRASREPCLITIDTRTARARKIGNLGVRGTDINFDVKGTLYVWLLDSNRLGTVDLANGKVTPIGSNGHAPGKGEGLAINASGVAIVASGPKKSVLDEVDPTTGKVIGGLALIDSSVVNAITALTLSPTGVLFAVNSVASEKPTRELVSIDTDTGTVTKIGALPDEIDAIAFEDGPKASRSKAGLLALILAVLLLLNVAGMVRWRNR